MKLDGKLAKIHQQEGMKEPLLSTCYWRTMMICCVAKRLQNFNKVYTLLSRKFSKALPNLRYKNRRNKKENSNDYKSLFNFVGEPIYKISFQIDQKKSSWYSLSVLRIREWPFSCRWTDLHYTYFFYLGKERERLHYWV